VRRDAKPGRFEGEGQRLTHIGIIVDDVNELAAGQNSPYASRLIRSEFFGCGSVACRLSRSRILSKLIVCQSNIAFNMQKCMAQTVQDAQGTPVFV
jgi:hypothetical protein